LFKADKIAHRSLVLRLLIINPANCTKLQTNCTVVVRYWVPWKPVKP